MPRLVAKLPKTKLKFYVSPDEINPQLEKKMASLGWPELDLRYSHDNKLQLEDLGEGKFRYKKGDFGDSIPLIEPTQNGSFSVTYDSSDLSVTCEFEGEFLVFDYTDEDSAGAYTIIKTAYASGIQIADAKGKSIKKPKNDYGMTLPLEATVVPGEYGDVYLAVSLEVTSSD